jgi:hypothetical protein
MDKFFTHTSSFIPLAKIKGIIRLYFGRKTEIEVEYLYFIT